MPTRSRRSAVAALRVACGLVVASTLLGPGPARAQDTPPTLGGFTGSAAASGLHARYMPEGLLPTGPPVDLGAPDALATVASGPATFARASVLDPGDLLANPDALLALANSDYEAGTIPAYPYRISASSGVGEPAAESNPAPGLNARVSAGPGASSAQATMPGASVPAVVTFGSMVSRATTQVDGTTVSVHARSEINGIDILGIVAIESVVTDLTATSSGGDTVLEGATTVTGATVLGTPATIDDRGIRAAVGGVDLGSVLSTLGVTVTLPGPVGADGGTSGQLASTGLRIDIAASGENVPGLGDLLDALPPLESPIPGAPSPEDLLVAVRARHLVSVELGRGAVSLTARAATPRRTAPAVTPAAPTPAPATGAAVAPLPSPPAARAPAAAAPSTPAAAPAAASTPAPAASLGAGIGALAVLLLLLQPFVGDRLARAAAVQLATDQEGCPWEQR